MSSFLSANAIAEISKESAGSGRRLINPPQRLRAETMVAVQQEKEFLRGPPS